MGEGKCTGGAGEGLGQAGTGGRTGEAVGSGGACTGRAAPAAPAPDGRSLRRPAESWGVRPVPRGRGGQGAGEATLPPPPGRMAHPPSSSEAPPLPLLPPFPPPRAGPRPPPPPPARPPSQRGPPGRPSRAPPHSPPTPRRGVDSSLPLMVAAEGRAQGGPVRGGWGGPGKTRTLTRQANPDRTGRGG